MFSYSVAQFLLSIYLSTVTKIKEQTYRSTLFRYAYSYDVCWASVLYL